METVNFLLKNVWLLTALGCQQLVTTTATQPVCDLNKRSLRDLFYYLDVLHFQQDNIIIRHISKRFIVLNHIFF